MAGNKISEWQKGTFLYNQLVMRAKASIVQEYGVIRAMLWYQGESDTMSQSDANSYKGKMQQFFSDLRNDVGIPELLIIQVNLNLALSPFQFVYLVFINEYFFVQRWL
uniref:Sialate O-acetylesterase domain-containing protein n=1 Tax=Solanum tuberosum TaxID=4113 RepID=M1A9C5_SOLTU